MKSAIFVCSLCAVVCGLLAVGDLDAQDTLTIGINFAADEPPDIGSEVEGPAGLLGTSNWNNLELNFGLAGDLIDSDGNETSASVIWESQNTWASAPVETSPGVFEGRNETNILDSVPPSPDRNLATGYVDSDAVDRFCTPDETNNPLLGGPNWCGANRVIVGGLPYEEPYDVILYFNGGVPDRGGFVRLNDDITVVQHDTGPFTGTWDLSSEERVIDGETYTVYTGDVLIFSEVSGGTFQIDTHGFDLGQGTFRSFINAIEITGEIGTIGRPCDFTDDGLCNTDDIDALMTDAATGGTSTDMNMDGIVNDDDRDLWLASAGPENGFAGPFLVGDGDLNGKVEAPDLNVLGIAWQNREAFNWSNGNYTSAGDPGVSVNDLNGLGLNWQQEVALAGARAVPEPTGMALLLLGFCGLFVVRRR